MRKIFLSVAMLSSALTVMAERTIKGVVKDANEPLPFANVSIKGTTKGVTTDFDGAYEITVEDGQVLEFSYAGYDTKEIKVGPKTGGTLNVTLSEETLDEVVVVGYGTVRKSDVVSSVSALSESKLKEGVSTSIDQALAGRVAGVSVTSSSGQPGQATSVRIRGVSSLSGSSDPLYVVDGMPIGGGNSEYSASSNPLASINPADIVSMEILKDASATAIYGSRAANGVVMITTRKGKNGSAKFTYDGNFSVSQFTKRYDMMDLKQYAEYVNDEYVRTIGRGSDPDELLTQPSILGKGTDWQDELFRLGVGHSHQISASGGNEKTQFNISLGYTGQNGIIQNTNYKRINGRVNLESEIKSWMKMGMNVGITRQTKTSAAKILDLSSNSASCYTFKEMDESVIMTSLLMLPSDSPYSTEGEPWGPATAEGVTMNPIAYLEQSPIERAELNVMGTAFMELIFLNKTTENKLMRRLSWRTEFGIDLTNADDNYFQNPAYDYGTLFNTPDNASELRGDYKNNSIRLSSYLTWLHDFSKRHHLNFMAGMELNKFTYNGQVWKNTGFPLNNPHTPNLAASHALTTYYKGTGSMASWFGRFTYNFADRYLLTATGRADGSSNFAPGHKWGFFPSIGFAWRVEQEEFAQSESFKKVFSAFKVRAGWGQTGNANCQQAHLSTISPWANEQNYGYNMFGPNQYTNPDLTWETNTQINLALDLGFLNNRLGVTIDGYYKKNKDLLLKQELPSYVAQSDYKYIQPSYVNAGSMRNIGLDLAINAQCINKKLKDNFFVWETELTFSLVRSKVMDLGEGCDAIYDYSDSRGAYRLFNSSLKINKSVVGEAPGKFYGYQSKGVIMDQATADEYNQRTSRNASVGDLMFSDEQTWIGDPNPKFTAGWNNTLSYGPWSLSLQFNGSYGNDVYNLVRMKLEAMSGEVKWQNQLADVLNFAKIGKDENGNVTNNAKLPAPSSADPNGNAKTVSDRYVEDGSYLKLANVALTYTFKKAANEKLHIEGLHITASCANVCTITGYSGYDPENPGSAVRQGVDEARYPSPRNYSISLGFSF